jgi:Zn-dependent protease with chaperone function
MLKVDLDFQRYVERRKGAIEAQAREGATYAYAGEARLRRAFGSLRPVRLAVEGTQRLSRAEDATRIAANDEPRLQQLVARAADRLHVRAPEIFFGASQRVTGSDEEPRLVFERGLVGSLTDEELLHAIGAELGRVQNGHVVYLTALHHLQNDAARFVRWIVSPAVLALSGWAKRAVYTADRAGLLCTRDLAVSEAAIAKLAQPADVARRTEALRLFADTIYYRGIIGSEGGVPTNEIDAKVGRL